MAPSQPFITRVCFRHWITARETDQCNSYLYRISPVPRASSVGSLNTECRALFPLIQPCVTFSLPVHPINGMTSTPSASGSRSDISVAPPRHFSAGNQRRVSIDLKKIAGNFCLRVGERCRCSPSLTLTGEDHVLSTHFSQKQSQITLQVLRSQNQVARVGSADWRNPAKHS